MKTYIEHNDYLTYGATWIPKDPANSDYQAALKEVADGEAEFVEYVPPAVPKAELKRRLWAAGERYFAVAIEAPSQSAMTVLAASRGAEKVDALYGWLAQEVLPVYVAGCAEIDLTGEAVEPDFSNVAPPPYTFEEALA